MSIADKLTTIAENEQKVYDAGYNKYNEDFWTALTAEHDPSYIGDYSRAFNRRFSSKIFYPTKDLIVKNSNAMFQEFGKALWYSPLDLAERLEQQGVILDTSLNARSFAHFVYESFITRIPKIDTTSFTGGFEYSFYSTSLVTIDELVLREDGVQTFPNTFKGNLANIKISGCIGNNISFSLCSKLTVESLKSIIDALKDLTGTEITRTLTLGTTNLKKLTDAEKAIATQKGWTIT